MFEALLTSTALALGLAIGFVIAWARGGKTREELAALQARAEEQEKAAEEKLALVANTQAALSRSSRRSRPRRSTARAKRSCSSPRPSSVSSKSARRAISKPGSRPSTSSCSRSKSR